MLRPRLVASSILVVLLLVPFAFAQKRIGEWRPIYIGETTLLDSKVFDAPREGKRLGTSKLFEGEKEIFRLVHDRRRPRTGLSSH